MTILVQQNEILSGRDVAIAINWNPVLQAEKAELHRVSELHPIRSCFCSDDIAYIRSKCRYKLHMIGLRFRQPFENLSMADLDNFTVTVSLDGKCITLSGCMWDDFLAAADQKQFREHISAVALRMNVEDEE